LKLVYEMGSDGIGVLDVGIVPATVEMVAARYGTGKFAVPEV